MVGEQAVDSGAALDTIANLNLPSIAAEIGRVSQNFTIGPETRPQSIKDTETMRDMAALNNAAEKWARSGLIQPLEPDLELSRVKTITKGGRFEVVGGDTRHAWVAQLNGSRLCPAELVRYDGKDYVVMVAWGDRRASVKETGGSLHALMIGHDGQWTYLSGGSKPSEASVYDNRSLLENSVHNLPEEVQFRKDVAEELKLIDPLRGY